MFTVIVTVHLLPSTEEFMQDVSFEASATKELPVKSTNRIKKIFFIFCFFGVSYSFSGFRILPSYLVL